MFWEFNQTYPHLLFRNLFYQVFFNTHMDLTNFTHKFLYIGKNVKLSYYFSDFQPRTPYLVLLPGSFSPAEQYKLMISYFSTILNVVVIEYRGHGLSWPPIKKGSIQILAQDVILVLSELSISKFFVAGHSIGGMIAIELGKTQLDSILGIISIEGWTNHLAAKNAYGRLLNNTYTEEQEQYRQKLRNSVLNRWNKRQQKYFGSLWRKWNGLSFLISTEIPILEIYGDRARKIPPSREVLQIPDRENIDFILIKNASHNLPLQYPEKIARLIQSFIEKHFISED
jgi:pimeloyl-ACP methyl ester carboxylesterase